MRRRVILALLLALTWATIVLVWYLLGEWGIREVVAASVKVL